MAERPDGPLLEVFADVGCPFTHVGLRRLVEHRARLGREDVRLWVRAWPLEVVNGTPMDAHYIAEEVDELRDQVAPDLFTGFTEAAFPSTSLPAMALAAAAYRHGAAVGEAVSLGLRDLCFEQGRDVADPDVLAGLAAAHGIDPGEADRHAVLGEHAEGSSRGVVGSPHFFTAAGDFFCPSLDISRDDAGRLHIAADVAAFDAFAGTAFS